MNSLTVGVAVVNMDSSLLLDPPLCRSPHALNELGVGPGVGIDKMAFVIDSEVIITSALQHALYKKIVKFKSYAMVTPVRYPFQPSVMIVVLFSTWFSISRNRVSASLWRT